MTTKIRGLIIVVWCVSLTSAQRRNNVCSRIEDYSIIDISKNCWYNPDVGLSVPEIVKRNGYPLETYDVITKDGYIMKLFRIPYGRNSIERSNEILQPVLLQHGFISSAYQFVDIGNRSLAYIMADAGYDVWIANARGTTYGKDHVRLSVKDPRFWNFSITELGIYDTPANLDLIYKVTNRNDTIMIGHSMGTSTQLIYGAELPEHARNRVKYMIYMAPAAYLGTINSPISVAVRLLPLGELIERWFGSSEILARHQFPKNFFRNLCYRTGLQFRLCQLLTFAVIGFDWKNFSPEVVPVVFSHYPSGASFKTLLHLGQAVATNVLSKYDYGPELNLQYYQSEKPPRFDFSQIEIPGMIMYGASDALTNPEDADELIHALPKDNNILYKVPDRRYNHLDFYYARNVVEQVFDHVLKVLEPYKTTITV